jgi:transcriptional regulator with XRE-family HTH domain
MENYLQRIQQYIEYKGLSNRSFEAALGISNGLIARNIKMGSDLSAGVVEKILRTYPEINPCWLMLGELPMLRTGKGATAEELRQLEDKYDALQAELSQANKELVELYRERKSNESKDIKKGA